MTKHAVALGPLQWVLASALTIVSAQADACTLAFERVRVVAMTTPDLARNQTVVIDGGKIIAVAPDLPTAGCRNVINGRGKYLAPGLIDAHVHVESEAFAAVFGGKAEPIDFEAVLALYPAFGVTAVRVMSGAPDILRFRDQPPSANPVPRLAVASPMIAGRPPILPEPVTIVIETTEAARAAVARFKAEGYDLIKLRENLRPEVVTALTAAANEHAIDLDGHVTRGMTVDALLASGQRGFAHLDEIGRSIASGGTSSSRLKNYRAHISSALVVLKSARDQITDYDRLARRPEMRFLHPLFVASFWARPRNPYAKPGADPIFFERLLELTKRTLRDLSSEGVLILAGSDALNPMIIPGVGLHEELQLMVEAGLTPYEALHSATVNPAMAIPRFANMGTIRPGGDADLVLLAANPFVDISAYRHPLGVVLQGRWFDRRALDARLDAIARTFHSNR